MARDEIEECTSEVRKPKMIRVGFKEAVRYRGRVAFSDGIE